MILRTTPAENRKNNRRGRPKKEKIQVVSNQPKFLFGWSTILL